MNEENVKFLKDNIKYMGFGEKLYEELANKVSQGKDNFTLDFKAVINNKAFDASLHFGKSANTDMYFFNSFNASLEKKNGEIAEQTFYLNKTGYINYSPSSNPFEGSKVYLIFIN